jgi:hypothetical protein
MDPVLAELYLHVGERFERLFDAAHEDGPVDPARLFKIQCRIEKLRDALWLLREELGALEVEDGDSSSPTPEGLWRPSWTAP